MTHRPRSLKHEYELFVEREIESYKESAPRSVILAIGDEAAASLAAQQQLALTEILLWAEVDRIIRARLRIPSYVTWRRHRLKALKELSKPERWGLRPDGPIAQTLWTAADGHVLVASAGEEGPTLYLAANGCAVTALDPTEQVLERVIDAATQVGLTGRIRALVADLASWAPDMPLDGVVCAAGALAGLSPLERSRALLLLQDATTAGGVHVVETRIGSDWLMTVDELRSSYDGWHITVQHGVASRESFLARKAVA